MPTSGRLDIKRLRVFSQAARASSFARAAEVLGYSPSAISQQISTLERDLGVVLFERGARGVRLTDAGSALLGHAEVVLEKIDEAESQIESIAGLTGGELRFGSFTSATAVFAAAAVEEFRASYPAVEVRFVDGEPFESISRLVAAELDLALVFDFDRWRADRSYEGVLLPAENGLRLLPLFDDPFLLLVPRAHRLAASESVTMHDLAGETILGAPPWVDDVEHLCRAAGVDVEIDRSRRATGFEAFQAFVALGRGSRSCRDSPWAGAGRRSYRFRSRAIRSGTSRPRSWHAPTTRQPSRPCPSRAASDHRGRPGLRPSRPRRDLALAWALEPDVPAGSGVRAMRLLVVRGFARYMEGVDPQTEVPPAGLFPSRQRRRAPFIYSDADILALMAQAQRVIREPLRAATCETLIGLFAVHGLRTRSRLDLQSRSRQRSPSSSDRRRPADAAVRISTRITGPRRRSAVAAPRRVCRVGSRETTSLGIDEMTASSSSSVRNWMSGSASRCRRRFGRAARDTGSMVAQPLSIASEKDARGTSSRS